MEGSDRLCRAGCNAVETALQPVATHVVQVCFRTHGGRVKRHDAVSKTLAAELRQKRWKVSEENRIITSEGLRKPDIICQRQNEVWVRHASSRVL